MASSSRSVIILSLVYLCFSLSLAWNITAPSDEYLRLRIDGAIDCRSSYAILVTSMPSCEGVEAFCDNSQGAWITVTGCAVSQDIFSQFAAKRIDWMLDVP